MYEFVCNHLRQHGGQSTRSRVLAAFQDDDAAQQRLNESQGLSAVLTNMKQSGFVTLEGEAVQLPSRALGRRVR